MPTAHSILLQKSQNGSRRISVSIEYLSSVSLWNKFFWKISLVIMQNATASKALSLFFVVTIKENKHRGSVGFLTAKFIPRWRISPMRTVHAFVSLLSELHSMLLVPKRRAWFLTHLKSGGAWHFLQRLNRG